MCTNETRQEVAYLLALGSRVDRFTSDQIEERMRSNLDHIGWPSYLLHTPKTEKELAARALRFDFVEKVNSVAWKITDKGMSRIRFLIDTYVPADKKEKVRSLVRDAEPA